jgi:lipoyl(octanoyl) transferase
VPRQVLVYVARPAKSDGWEWLLLHRLPRRGGFWQGVSGAPVPGEDDAAAVARELREETGLVPDAPPAPLGYGYLLERRGREDWERTYGHGVEHVTEETYVACAPEGFEPTIAVDEHDAYRWCALDEALARLRFAENREALRRAAGALDHARTRPA